MSRDISLLSTFVADITRNALVQNIAGLMASLLVPLVWSAVGIPLLPVGVVLGAVVSPFLFSSPSTHRVISVFH